MSEVQDNFAGQRRVGSLSPREIKESQRILIEWLELHQESAFKWEDQLEHKCFNAYLAEDE